jgi:hypothetical protein
MNNPDHSRREVLKLMGLGRAALTLSDFKFFSTSSYRADIGLQLYTVRESIERDLEGTLRRVADIGFLGIEYYPLSNTLTPKHVGKVLKDVGLKVLGMHLPLPS